jgi:LysM repeat protein
MKRLHWARMILSGTFILALGACAHKPAKPVEGKPPVVQFSPTVPQDGLLQELRTENDNLRAELGSLKILMAKQAGEIQTLREQSQSIHHREQDQGTTLQKVRAELLSTQTERDQLRKHNTELEGRVASMPDTSQLVSDIQALTASFQHIMTSMKQLTTDITLIKRKIHINPDKRDPQRTTLTTSEQHPSSRELQTPDAQGRIVIRDGDSLWKLARQYDVSVTQLKEWNGINSDVIRTGFPLRVTLPAETQANRTQSSIEPPAPPVSQEQVKEPVPQHVPAPDNRVETAPEPKHILSLGSSGAESDETP